MNDYTKDNGRGEEGGEFAETTIKGKEESDKGEDQTGTEGMAGITTDTPVAAGATEINPMMDSLSSETRQEETLKEQNRRLLSKEQELLSQKKAKTSRREQRKRKHLSLSDAPLGIEERNVSTIQNSDNDNVKGRVKNVPRQRESWRVDRRWEFELM